VIGLLVLISGWSPGRSLDFNGIALPCLGLGEGSIMIMSMVDDLDDLDDSEKSFVYEPGI
jgi:hypothetical protein